MATQKKKTEQPKPQKPQTIQASQVLRFRRKIQAQAQQLSGMMDALIEARLDNEELRAQVAALTPKADSDKPEEAKE